MYVNLEGIFDFVGEYTEFEFIRDKNTNLTKEHTRLYTFNIRLITEFEINIGSNCSAAVIYYYDLILSRTYSPSWRSPSRDEIVLPFAHSDSYTTIA